MNPLFVAELTPYAPPSLDNWMGSNALGQPFLPLLMQGTAFTLVDIGAATSLSLAIAIVIASLGSIFRGTWGRFAFTLASTFSFSTPLIAVLLLLYSILGDRPEIFPITAGCLLWGNATLTLQTAISQESGSTYIKAARGLGIGRIRLIFYYLLPNLMAPLRAAWLASWPATLTVSILAAYLGAHGGSPRLGSLLNTGYEIFPACWWLWLPPTMIVCATFAASFIATEHLFWKIRS